MTTRMHNPPHPGEVLQDTVLAEDGISETESWLLMQAMHDLWRASNKRRPKVEPLKLAA